MEEKTKQAQQANMSAGGGGNGGGGGGKPFCDMYLIIGGVVVASLIGLIRKSKRG